jgi:glutathione-regulated potassium-efflux system protein KefB
VSLLLEAIVYLTAAIIAVPISKRLGFGSVLGYLAAGMLIGPHGFAIMQNAEHILHFAELGVVFLLFIIGLELQPSRLWILRRMVFGLGSAQVILSALVIGVIALIFGLPPIEAAVTGTVLALSSTAFVLQMLSEKKQLSTPHGRTALTILLFQDLAVIPLIALLPLLGNTAAASFSYANIALMILTIGGLIIGGRYLLRPIMRVVARTEIPELFTAMGLLVVIGAALLMELANMSMVLGAFIAGMMLADSEFRHELEANIAPFKGLLLGLFFIAVGMTVNLELLTEQPLTILTIVVLLMSAKALVLFPLARLFGLTDTKSSASLAAILCQGGEFAFVLFALVAHENILEQQLIDQLILAVTISMMLTPVVYLITERMTNPREEEEGGKPEYDPMEIQHHAVIIAGFGRVGQIVGRLLRIAQQPFTALEYSPSQVEVVRRYGSNVHYGDASKLDLLRAAGVGHAKLFVLTIGNVKTSLRTAELVSKHFPQLTIVARARNRQHQYKLMDLGIKHIYRETLFSSVELSKMVMTDLGMNANDVEHIANLFIEHDQSLLVEQHAIYHDEEQLIQTSKEIAQELDSLLKEDLKG